MRRFISGGLCVFSCVWLASIGLASAVHAQEPLPGDVNRDGVINLGDTGIIANRLLAPASLPDEDLARADANQDGVVDVADVISTLVNRSSINVGITLDAEPVLPGQLVNVTIAATNLGAQAAADVTFRFTIPPFADVGNFNPGEVYTVNQGPLPVGRTVFVVLPLRIRSGGNAPPDGTILNLAANVQTAEGQRTDIARSLAVRTPRVLALSMLTDYAPVEPGQRIRYTLQFGNQSVNPGFGASLTMPIPYGVADATVDEGGVIDSLSRAATWDLGDIAAGTTGQVHLFGTISDRLFDGELILAEAELATAAESARASLATSVVVNSPLEFDISADDDPVVPGQFLRIRLTATNRGGEALTDVVMRLVVPDYADYGNFNPGETITLNVGTLNPGQSITQYLPMLIRSGGLAPPNGNILRFTGVADCVQGFRAHARRDVTVTSLSRIELGLTADANPVAPSERLTYTIQYGNTDIISVFNAVIRMEVPLGLAAPAVDEGGVIQDGWATWNIGTIPAGAYGEVQLSADVAQLPEGSLIRAEAQLRADDRSAFSLIATLVKAPSPLLFELHASDNPVNPGQIVQLTLIASNRGTQPLTGIDYFLLMPDFADTGNYNPGEVYSAAVGALQPGESFRTNLPILIRSAASAPPTGRILHFSGWADSDQGFRGDASRDVVAQGARALDAGIQADVDPVPPGGELNYTIHYGNQSLVTAAGVTARMRIPDALGSAVADSGGAVNGGWAEWNLGSLTAGQSGQLHLSGIADAGLADGELLHAEVVLESNGVTARSRVATSVLAAQTLQFAVTSNLNPVAIGELLELTWTATNAGSQPLSDVQLSLVMPERMDFGNFNPGQTFPRNVGTLAAGQSFSEVLPIRIRSGGIGPLSGEVMRMGLTATSSQGRRSYLVRNFGTDNGRLLDVGIATDADPAVAGETLTYVVHFGNNGAATALGSTLRVALPGGLESPAADQGGTIQDGWATWNLGNLVAGRSGRVQVTGVVGALGSGTILPAEAVLQSGAKSARAALATAVQAAPSPLAFAVTSDADPTYTGQHAHVTFSISNTGDQTLNDLDVNVLMPDFVDIGNFNPGEVYLRELASLAPGQNFTETLPIAVRTSVNAPPAGQIMDLKAWASAIQGQRSVLGVNFSQEDGTNLDVGLAGNVSPAIVGGSLIYTIHYGNRNGAAANGTTLALRLPEGVSGAAPDGGGTVSDGVVTWALGDLPAGTSGVVHASVTVESLPAGQLLVARASIQSGVDQAHATLSTAAVAAESPLRFEVTEVEDAVAATDVVNVALKVTNVGAQQLNDVSVSLLMCEFGDMGIYNPGETFSSAIGLLGAGANATVNVPITIRTGGIAPPLGAVLHLSTWATSVQGFRSDLKRNLRVGN